MIEQKDIDRLLAGRKILDGIKRIDTTILQEKYAVIAKDQLATMTKAEIVTAKSEVDALYETEKQSILDAEKALVELGFTSESDFLKWDRELSYQAFKESIVLSSDKCDLCVGYEGEPPCKAVYKTGACLNVRPDEIVSLENGWKSFYSNYAKDGKENSLVCPKGHGFQVDWEKCQEFPFDVFWRR